MGLRINNNIAALNSYNNVNKTDKAVSSSLEKLSSGYRINKAADDAAGLVISEGLRSQIGGLTVASRNAQDGVNVAQTADGALGTVTSMLQRMRDLAVQASNTGSTDSDAAAAAQKEFAALRTEIGRVAGSTAFGGKNLLDGTYGATPASTSGFIPGNSLTLAADSSFDLTVAGGALVSVEVKAGTYSGEQFGAALESAIKSALTNSANAVNKAAAKNFHVDLTKVGSDSVVSIKADIADTTTFVVAAGGTDLLAAAGISSTVTAAAGAAAKFQVGANSGQTIEVNIGKVDTTAAGLNLDASNLSTDASAAIDAVDAALTKVNGIRADLGAVQNRFEHTINNLAVSIENITASESAIRDTDMAAEMTKFTKNQILSQAGTSMLAQANSSTQNILTLLRG